jgi:hypothetical protein
MAIYRIVLLDDLDRITGLEHCKCSSDEDAASCAFTFLLGYAHVEVWLGARLVRSFSGLVDEVTSSPRHLLSGSPDTQFRTLH